MRKTFLFIVLCWLVLIVAILFRIPLLEWSVPRYLAYKHVHTTAFELQSWSLNRLDIKALSVNFAHNQQPYTVAGSHISLGYTVAGLFAQTVDHLAIEQAVITLPSMSSTQVQRPAFAPSTLKDGITLLQNLTLPIHTLTIKQLRINGQSAAIVPNIPIALQVQTTDKALRSHFLFSLTDQEEMAVTLQRKQDHSLIATVSHTNKKQTVQTLQLAADATHIEAQAAVDMEELSRHTQLKQLQGLAGKVKTSATLLLNTPLSLHLQMDAEELQRSNSTIKTFHLALEATLDSARQVTLNNASRLQIEGLKSDTIQLQRLDFPLGSTLTATDEGVHWNFSSPQLWQVQQLEVGAARIKKSSMPALQEVFITKNTLRLVPQSEPLTFQEMNITGWSVPQLTLAPRSEIPITLTTTANALTITSPQWVSTAFTVRKDKQQLAFTSVEATLHKATLHSTLDTTFSLVAPTLVLSSHNATLPLKNITGKVELKEQQFNTTLHMLPSTNPGTIELQAKHSLRSGKGMARITTEEPLRFSHSHGLATLVHGIALPLTVTSGTLQVNMAASWQKKQALKAEASLHVTDGAGAVKNIPFSGLQIKHTLDLFPTLRSHTPGKLEIAVIGGTIPVTNLLGIFNVSSSGKNNHPNVAVQQLSANIVQGSITTDPFTYTPDAETQTIIIRADGLDLAEVVDLVKIKGLQVDGKVNGYLPLTLHQKEVTLENGEVYGSEQGGTIRFQPQGMPTEQSPFTAYALKALEEFHFTVLKAPVTYLPDGTLLVTIQLQGISPPLSTTRPVHLNIHTEQNLLSLLKSLRYNDALGHVRQ